VSTLATTVPLRDWMMPTYRRWPVEFVAGNGSQLLDAEGNRYLDCVAGLAVVSVGHANPKVTDAVARQAAQLVHVSNLYETRPQKLLAERLASLTDGMLSFFTNSGAEAVECALKLARKRAHLHGNGAPRVITTIGSFHGRTLGALAATGQPAKREPFEPLPRGFTYVSYGDGEALADAMDDDVAAVILEPIQGEAGVVLPPDGYLTGARSVCDRWDALLILDEVQTGLGRTGRWWAHEHEGVRPDVLCVAKALAAGLPMGACLARPGVAESFVPGDHATTFGGGPVQSAASLAVLDVISSQNLVARAEFAGRRLLQGLEEIFGPRAVVRGRGLLIGVELGGARAREFVERALNKKLVINDATPSVVRLAPPLVISDDEIDEALAIIREVFREIETS
jgi:acetylornithine/N-succinyldiaminopimelate aminotransferase